MYVTKNGKKVLVDPPIGYKEAYGPDAQQQTYEAIMSRPLPRAAQGAPDAETARRQRFPAGKSVVVNDYAGRPFAFATDTFDHHTTKKKYLPEHRYRTAHLVGEVLSAPDEVWLEFNRNTGEATHRYIRYYQGSPVAVQTKTILSEGGDHRMEVYTWYEMNKDTAATNRVGLLLKRNTR